MGLCFARVIVGLGPFLGFLGGAVAKQDSNLVANCVRVRKTGDRQCLSASLTPDDSNTGV